jgi:hypothetical protein
MRISKLQRFVDVWNVVTQSPRLNNERLAGYVEIQDGLLLHNGSFFGNWKLPIDDIVAIAQVDDLSGPWTEDLFYVFLFFNSNKLRYKKASVSAQAAGYGWSFEFLSEHFADMHPPCLLTPDPESVVSEVLWPKYLIGLPLYQIKPVLPSLRKIGLVQKSIKLSPDLVEELEKRHR